MSSEEKLEDLLARVGRLDGLDAFLAEQFDLVEKFHAEQLAKSEEALRAILKETAIPPSDQPHAQPPPRGPAFP
jgi:hypothetical protein